MITKGDLVLIVNAIKQEFDPRFESIDKQLKSIRKDIRNLYKFTKVFDRDLQETRSRVDRVENHLNVSD